MAAMVLCSPVAPAPPVLLAGQTQDTLQPLSNTATSPQLDLHVNLDDDDMFESGLRSNSESSETLALSKRYRAQSEKASIVNDATSVPRTPVKPTGALLDFISNLPQPAGEVNTSPFATDPLTPRGQALSPFSQALLDRLPTDILPFGNSALSVLKAEENASSKAVTESTDEPMASLTIRLAPKPQEAVVPPPSVGDCFESREAFKQACQKHAVSLSTVKPEQRFHFSTRTSSVGKWLVFSCHAHVRGCPVAVRAEKMKDSEEWTVTSTNYAHNHFHAPPKTARKFTVVKKKPQTVNESNDTKATLKTAKIYKPRNPSSRSYSFNGQSNIKRKLLEPASQAAIMRYHKRNLQRLATGPAALPGSSDGNGSPRFKSEREHGRSRQHSVSGIRRNSDVGSPSSPADSDFSFESDNGSRPRSYSNGATFGSLSSGATNPFDRNAFHSSQSVRPIIPGTFLTSRSPSAVSNLDVFIDDEPKVDYESQTLEQYLTGLHQSLAEMVQPLAQIGVTDVKTLLSLDKDELACLVDSIPEASATPLQRLLLKNRVGRHLL